MVEEEIIDEPLNKISNLSTDLLINEADVPKSNVKTRNPIAKSVGVVNRKPLLSGLVKLKKPVETSNTESANGSLQDVVKKSEVNQPIGNGLSLVGDYSSSDSDS